MLGLVRKGRLTCGSQPSDSRVFHSSPMYSYILGLLKDENDMNHYNPGRHFSACDPGGDGDCWGVQSPNLRGAIFRRRRYEEHNL